MITKEQKNTVIKEFARNANDTGSSEVQVGILTERIKQVAEHLETYPKDKHSQRGLVLMLGKRRTHLKFLKKTNESAYQKAYDLMKSKGSKKK